MSTNLSSAYVIPQYVLGMINKLGHNKHWNDYKRIMLDPNPKLVPETNAVRNFAYYYNCAEFHPGKTCR